MSDKIDDILSSGCLEKLIESDLDTSTKEDFTAYLAEHGFKDVADGDLKTIIDEIRALESASGGGLINNKIGNVKAKQSCNGNFGA